MGFTHVPLKHLDFISSNSKIIAELPMAISILSGDDFIIELANKKNLALWQKKSEEILNKPFFEVFPSFKSTALETILQEVYHTAIEYTQKEIPITINSKTSWFNITYKPIDVDSGYKSAVMMVYEDITKQKQTEDDAKELTQKLELTLTNVPSSIFLFNHSGKIIFANKIGVVFFGYDSEETLINENNGSSIVKRVINNYELFDENHKRLNLRNLPSYITLRTGEASENVILTVYKKDNSATWILSKAAPLFDDEGKLSMMVVTVTDITLQKLAEEKSIQARELFEKTLNHVPSAIYHLDKTGKFLYVNELAAKQMGYKSIEEVLAVKNVYEFRDRLDENFVLLDENGKVLQANESCTSITLSTGKAAEVMVKFISKKDKSSFWLLTKSVPLHDDKGELTNVFTSCTDITAQKNSEEALKYRKALLEAQNEAIPDAILIVDEEGEILSFNKKFAKIWEMPDEIVANKDDNAALAFAMTRVIDPEGFIERVRYCYAHPDMKSHDEIFLKDGRVLDRYGNAVVGEDGTPYGWAWYFRDITEQKRGEIVIKESEEKYRGLFEKMDQGFCIVEVIFDSESNPIDYRFLESNPMFKYQTGLDNADGKTIKELVPDIEIMWSQRYGQVVKTGQPIRFTDYSQAMNTWFEVYAFRLGDKNSNKVAILFTNITERKKSEIELKESEERFRRLTETIPQMVWMTDEKGNPEYLSSQWIEYAGEMPIADYWTAICHPDDTESANDTWIKSVVMSEKFVSETRLKNKEGEYRWHVSIGVPLKNDKQEIVKWIGSVTDIHDQKLKEQKKDEFISIASHEMKTPLTSMKAYLQLLEMSLHEDDPNFIYAKKASEATERLNKLISELLDASKIQHGKLNYHNTTFNFEEMIDSTIENVQYSSITHKIIKLGSISKHFWGDRDRLQQVVINLLTNAIKYSPNANEVIVKIEKENNQVHVSVTDNGVGMSDKHLEKVFDRYYRVEEHSIQFQGLGIGLYISYDIIKRHSGDMWVESVLGEGSTFHFTLPFVH